MLKIKGMENNIQNDEWKRKIPNALTAFRFLIVPFFVYLLYTPTQDRMLWAAVVFLLASITDWLDGFIARLYSAESILGKLLDPLADKILVMAALVMLAAIPVGSSITAGHYIPAWLVVLLLSREFLVTGLRSLAAVKGTVVAASNLAKYKTALTMIAIILLLIGPSFEFPFTGISFYIFGLIFLWLSAAVSIISGLQYAVRLRRFLS